MTGSSSNLPKRHFFLVFIETYSILRFLCRFATVLLLYALGGVGMNDTLAVSVTGIVILANTELYYALQSFPRQTREDTKVCSRFTSTKLVD